MLEPNHYIEQTNLRPDLTNADIDKLVKEAVKYKFVGVCIPPFWIKSAKRGLLGTGTNVVSVIGFPFGYQKTESKLSEIEEAINDGVDELDIVLNVSSFKSEMTWPKIELAKCNKLIHENGKVSKVIIETGYLSKNEIKEATKIVVDSGSDYVKTSTGVLTTGANVEDVQMIRELAPDIVRVKASGGIKTLDQLRELVNAGADRIGTSSGVSIMGEFYA